MRELNEQQIALISAYIRQHGVAHDDLHDDLLDHVCTSIEFKLNEGERFETAFADTIKLFGPGGLKQVQQQTFELLTEINETMKKVAFVFGLTSAFLLLAGTIFKLMHWPGAGIMIVLGGAVLSLFYLPTLLYYKLKEAAGKDAIQHVSGFVGLGLTAIGVTFKIMHWPGASFLLLSGIAILGFLYVPIYFYKQYKHSTNKPVTLSASLVAMTCLILVFALINVKSSSEMNRGLSLIADELEKDSGRFTDMDMLYDRVKNKAALEDLRINADGLVRLIDDYKAHLISHTEGVPVEEARKMRVDELDQRFTFDIPTHILFDGTGEHAGFTAEALRLELIKFEQILLASYDSSLYETIHKFQAFDIHDQFEIEGKPVSWSEYHFYHVPLIGVIASLNNLQLHIRSAEVQAVLCNISQPEAAGPPTGS